MLGNITFSDTEANIGNGMNPDTGVFNVPVSGIYSFSFSACTNTKDRDTEIRVFKNGEIQFWFHNYNENDQSDNNIGYTWTMSLVQNDQINLQLFSNELIGYMYEFVWFNGQLLMQQ